MKLSKIVPNKLLTAVAKQAFLAKKNSPHIFFGLGITGVVASTVLACRSTLKLSSTLDEIQKDIEQLKPDPNVLVEDERSGELHIAKNPNHAHDTIVVYTKVSYKIVRLYAPAIIVGAAAITALAGSHVQLARRNSALIAAYAGIERAYAAYRERVRKEVGDERELELYHDANREMIKNADGDYVEAHVVDPTKFSQYAKIFDEYNVNWRKDPELNRMFLEVQEAYFNNRLTAYGHVFLNEVYDRCNFPRTNAGAVVGWLKNGDGDGFVSFGMLDVYNSGFVNGYNPSIILDFNVDGVIYDKIENPKEKVAWQS